MGDTCIALLIPFLVRVLKSDLFSPNLSESDIKLYPACYLDISLQFFSVRRVFLLVVEGFSFGLLLLLLFICLVVFLLKSVIYTYFSPLDFYIHYFFHYCGKIPDENSLREEGVMLTRGFKSTVCM